MIYHSDSIKQLETQISEISTYLNARPSGGLPSDTITSPKNDTHVMDSITRSDPNIHKYVVEIDENQNKIGSDEQANQNKKTTKEV